MNLRHAAALILIIAGAVFGSSCLKSKQPSGSSDVQVLITDFKCTMGSAASSSLDSSVFSIAGSAENMGAEPLQDVELYVNGQEAQIQPGSKTINVNGRVIQLPGSENHTPEAQIFLPHQIDPGRRVIFQVSGTTSLSLPSGIKDGAYLGRVQMMVAVPVRGSLKFATEKGQGYQLDFPVYLNRHLKVAATPAECNGKVLRRPAPWEGGNWVGGKCYYVSGVILRWVSATQALLGPNKDKPLFVQFSNPPEAKLGLNPTIAIDEGTYPYTNEFGAFNLVPRLKALEPLSAIATAPDP